jgi:hypothetical protein
MADAPCGVTINSPGMITFGCPGAGLPLTIPNGGKRFDLYWCEGPLRHPEKRLSTRAVFLCIPLRMSPETFSFEEWGRMRTTPLIPAHPLFRLGV